jgi:hypothetical protein
MFDQIVSGITQGRGNFTHEDIRLAVAAGVLASQQTQATNRHAELTRQANSWHNELCSRYPGVGTALGTPQPAGT